MSRRFVPGRVADLHQHLAQLDVEALARRVKQMALHMPEHAVASVTGLSVEQVRVLAVIGAAASNPAGCHDRC